MKQKTTAKTNIYWRLYQDEPVLKPSFPSSILADPSFLFPEDSLDHRWHLFAHTLFGIVHYHSENGIEWSKPKRILANAMRPFIYVENATYYLYYEKYEPFSFLLSWLKKRKWKSEIQVRTSLDLKNWSEPKTVLSPTKDWHSDDKLGEAVGNPCLVKIGNRYRLYFSSSLVFVPDKGYNESLHIGIADAISPLGPFSLFSKPILSANPMDPYSNLSAGSIKVVRWKDRLFGFQNGIFWNPKTKTSGSAILFLQSEDGIHWDKINDTPILGPTGQGWKASHVPSCDVKFSESEKVFIIYFNARNKPHWLKGKEAIGLFVGKVEEETIPMSSSKKNISSSKKDQSKTKTNLKSKPSSKKKISDSNSKKRVIPKKAKSKKKR